MMLRFLVASILLLTTLSCVEFAHVKATEVLRAMNGTGFENLPEPLPASSSSDASHILDSDKVSSSRADVEIGQLYNLWKTLKDDDPLKAQVGRRLSKDINLRKSETAGLGRIRPQMPSRATEMASLKLL
jgi:hypothetical protein